MIEQIRSFIAIELPEEVKSGLKKIQDYLKSADPSHAKWVNPDSIHLTLKFLGNINSGKIDEIVQAMIIASQSVAPFDLELKELGAFPNLRRVQIVWIGLNGDLDQLRVLQNNIESNIAPLGFPTEKRPFTPHLTLARLREFATPEQSQLLGNIISNMKIETNFAFKVNLISLMKSQLTRNGAIYTRLHSVELKASC